MGSSLLLALGSIVLLAPAGAIDVSDALRVYARHRQVDDRTRMDVEDLPHVALSLDWPALELGAEYAPRLSWLDVLGRSPSSTVVFHDAALHVTWQQPRYTLSLVQTGSWGSRDFAAGASSVTNATPAAATSTSTDTGATGAPTTGTTTTPSAPAPTSTEPSVVLLPSRQVLRFAAEETQASLHYVWAPRWSSDFDASLGWSGGENAAARVFLPLQRRIDLGAGLAYQLTRRDSLDTQVAVSQIETSNGYDHWLGALGEAWSHQLSRTWSSELGAGVALRDSRAPDGSHVSAWSPTADAALGYELRKRSWQVGLQWHAGYAPQINSVLGTLQSRLQGGMRATLTFYRTSLSASVDGAQTLPTDAPDAVRLISTTLGADRALLEWLDAQAGAQLTWQRSGIVSTFPQSFWLLYAGLGAHAPSLRF